MGRVVALGLVAVIGVSLGLAVLGLALSDGGQGNNMAEPAPPASGMALLQNYRCERAENKRVVVRGVEDNFSPQGAEPIYIHPRLRSPRLESIMEGGIYDQSQPDRYFIDTIELPPNISRGLLVIALRPLTDNSNDTIAIGDYTTADGPAAGARMFTGTMSDLATLPGWEAHGQLYYVEFGRLRFRTNRLPSITAVPERVAVGGGYSNLLEYVRGGNGPRPVDVRVADDTSVDFLAMAVCEEPPRRMGLTYGLDPLSQDVPGIVRLSCDLRPGAQRRCNPYVGDTPCGTPLPVACFRDLEAPIPEAAAVAGLSFHWSGGRLAAAPPVPASRFATVEAANAYCAATFGEGWRVATYHDGGRPSVLAAYGDLGQLDSSLWIDIRGQPYATCWAH